MKKPIRITFALQAISDSQAALCLLLRDEGKNAAFVEGLQLHRDFQLIIACCDAAYLLKEEYEEINLLFKNELNIDQLSSEKKMALIASLLKVQERLNVWPFTPANFAYQLVLLAFIQDMRTRFDFHLEASAQGQALIQEWIKRSWVLLEALKKHGDASFFQATLPSHDGHTCSFVLSDEIIAYLEKQIQDQHLFFNKQKKWLNFQYDRIKEHPVSEFINHRKIKLFPEDTENEAILEIPRFAKFKRSVFFEIRKAIDLMEELMEIHRQNRMAFEPFLDFFDDLTNKTLARLSEASFIKYLDYANQTHDAAYFVKKLETVNNWCYHLISCQYLLEVAKLYQAKKTEFFSLVEATPSLSESMPDLEKMIMKTNEKKNLSGLADHLEILEEWIKTLQPKEELQLATHPNMIFSQNQSGGSSSMSFTAE